MAERAWGFVDPDTIDEFSAITSLDRLISLTPESTLFNTPALRAVIVPQHGELIDSVYDGRLPLSIDVAEKIAMYAGARNGKWKSDKAFDDHPNNMITRFRDVNNTYLSESTYDQYWEVGVIWAQTANRTQAFYPAFSTVYKDDTSILRGLPFIMATCQIWKYAVRSWMRVTGNQKLTKEQLIDRSNRSIAEDCDGKFDKRFDITPKTYYTPADNQRGYSWTCDIEVKGNVMPTVGTYSLIVQRRDSDSDATRL